MQTKDSSNELMEDKLYLTTLVNNFVLTLDHCFFGEQEQKT